MRNRDRICLRVSEKDSLRVAAAVADRKIYFDFGAEGITGALRSEPEEIVVLSRLPNRIQARRPPNAGVEKNTGFGCETLFIFRVS